MMHGKYLKLIYDRGGRIKPNPKKSKFMMRSVLHSLVVSNHPRPNFWTRIRKNDLQGFGAYTKENITKEEFWIEFDKAVNYLRNFEEIDKAKFID